MPEQSMTEHMSEQKFERPAPAHTYFVQDKRAEENEHNRLRVQSELIADMAACPLAEQPDPSIFRRILDIGCGTGDWLIRAAALYPDIEQLVGIDINPTTIHFAESMAEEAGVADRVEFRQMDALRMLEFPDEYFDVANIRFGVSWLRTWDWPDVLKRMHRVLKPGGIARLADAKSLWSNGANFNRLWDLSFQAARRSGHLATDVNAGEESMTVLFPRYLKDAGFRAIQSRTFPTTHRAGTPEFGLFTEDMRLIMQHSAPYLKKWLSNDEYREYQELIEPAQAEWKGDFVCEWPMEAIWGAR